MSKAPERVWFALDHNIEHEFVPAAAYDEALARAERAEAHAQWCQDQYNHTNQQRKSLEKAHIASKARAERAEASEHATWERCRSLALREGAGGERARVVAMLDEKIEAVNRKAKMAEDACNITLADELYCCAHAYRNIRDAVLRGDHTREEGK